MDKTQINSNQINSHPIVYAFVSADTPIIMSVYIQMLQAFLCYSAA